ncbi:polysaccharide biosynthesis protein [bacterium 210820-DFI.6.37]|nr:polysaccharide biosynthesis protein [bacterium 210820-DFI.6.37]
MERKSFLQGAAVLAAAGLVVKVLGAAFKIPITNLIGDTGMASFIPAYNVYNFFLVFSTAGIPVAISKMVSENIAFGKYREAHRIFKLSRSLMLGIGALSFLITFSGAEAFANLISLPEAALAMKSVSPALIFVPLMASYRGYFQGMQDMKPTAASQVIEQGFRVAAGVALAYVMFQGAVASVLFDGFSPQAKGAAGASMGAAVGAVGGLVFIVILYYRRRKRFIRRIKAENKEAEESSKTILKKIAVIAVPITIGAAIMPIVGLIDAGVVSRRLMDAGLEPEIARGLYGQLTGFAGPLINFPQVLTQAVAVSLVPLIAAAYKKRDAQYLQKNAAAGIRVALMLGLPCSLGLMVLAKPILLLIYPYQADSAANAASCLMVLSAGVVFLSVVQTLTSILQGIGKQMIPVVSLSVGVALKIVITWFLVPLLGIDGAAIGTVSAYLLASILNWLAVKRYTGLKCDLVTTIIKPAFCTGAMALFAAGSYKALYLLLDGSRAAVLIAILLAAFLYFILLIVTGAVTRRELLNLPQGKRIDAILRKIGK